MHKRLESDLMSLAHEILQMKNKDDVFALKEKSKEIYEKLSLLAFVEEYINTTPNSESTKEELVAKVEKALEIAEKREIVLVQEESKNKSQEKVVHQLIEEIEPEVSIKEKENKEEKVEEIIEQPFDELESLMFEPDVKEIETKEEVTKEKKVASLEDELKDTIPVDEIASLFDTPSATKSLNDKLTTNIQIGLNDRIAFVKNLFDGSQEDFNRVVSQLNTFKSEKEAKNFINKMVKPDYNWAEQEALETRFIEIVERRFA